MIDFLAPTERMGAQTLRLLARAQYGAADIFEIRDVCRSLEPGDLAAWQRAWWQLADTVEREAVAAEAAGHRRTACDRYFHASTYYQHSDIFAGGDDPQRKVAFAASQAAFRNGARLVEPEVRVVSVTLGDETYDGYLCLPVRAADERVPGVLFIGGADAYGEETYFSGHGIIDRGMAMLILDTPGRGSAIYLKGMKSRPDYEVPTKAALDWLAAQPEVDPSRIGLVGISMGAYYAPRVAAFDPRVKALVAWGGIYSVLEDVYDYHPPIRGQLQWLAGASDDASAREILGRYTMEGLAERVTCPVMMTQGSADAISSTTGAKRLFDALGSSDKQYHRFDGPGQMHCSYDDWRHAVPLMFDWLRDRLG